MERARIYSEENDMLSGLGSLGKTIEEMHSKQNEIVDWINENELALVIIADWVAGKEKIFDKVVDQVEKERQARGGA